MCRGQHGGMTASTIRLHACSEKARTLCCPDSGGTHMRRTGGGMAVPGGSGGFGIFSQVCLLSADWPEMSGMRLPTLHTCSSASSGMHLQVGDAFRHNALLVLSIPFLALMCFSWMKRRRFPALYERLNGRVAVWTVFAVIIAWWIVRNIFQF